MKSQREDILAEFFFFFKALLKERITVGLATSAMASKKSPFGYSKFSETY
jgi:hypothetical protein